jgi:hypothetical protein
MDFDEYKCNKVLRSGTTILLFSDELNVVGSVEVQQKHLCWGSFSRVDTLIAVGSGVDSAAGNAYRKSEHRLLRKATPETVIFSQVFNCYTIKSFSYDKIIRYLQNTMAKNTTVLITGANRGATIISISIDSTIMSLLILPQDLARVFLQPFLLVQT